MKKSISWKYLFSNAAVVSYLLLALWCVADWVLVAIEFVLHQVEGALPKKGGLPSLDSLLDSSLFWIKPSHCNAE